MPAERLGTFTSMTIKSLSPREATTSGSAATTAGSAATAERTTSPSPVEINQSHSIRHAVSKTQKLLRRHSTHLQQPQEKRVWRPTMEGRQEHHLQEPHLQKLISHSLRYADQTHRASTHHQQRKEKRARRPTMEGRQEPHLQEPHLQEPHL